MKNKKLTFKQKIYVLEQMELYYSSGKLSYHRSMCYIVSSIIGIDIMGKESINSDEGYSKIFPEFIKSKPMSILVLGFWYKSGDRLPRLKHVQRLKAKMLKK